jgi:protein O-GlcNAc transferase
VYDIEPLLLHAAERDLLARRRPALSPFYANRFASVSLLLQRQLSEAYASAFSGHGSLRLPNGMAVSSDVSSRLLRLGFLSSDLTNHIVGHGMLALLSAIDRTRFETICFATADDRSDVRRRVVAAATYVHDARLLSHLDLARMINHERVDVLFDLNGWTRGNRLEVLAYHPAPIQAMFHGYAATTGAPFVHFVLSDKIAAPPDLSHQFSEKMLMLPPSCLLTEHLPRKLCADTPEGGCADREEQRRRLGVGRHTVLLANFNSLYKIDPHTFGIWLAVLAANPNASLWLLRLPADAEPQLRSYAARRNISGDRLLFSDLFDRREHLAVKSAADVFADTPLYNAHSSSADALWSGIPLVTLPGERMAARMAASVTTSAGAAETIARTTSEYARIIGRLVRCAECRRRIRHRLQKLREERLIFRLEAWMDSFQRVVLNAVDLRLSGPGERAYHHSLS